MKVPGWKSVTALAAIASIALGVSIGATPPQAATAGATVKVETILTANQLSSLPLTDRNLSPKEKVNLATVLKAYRTTEASSLNSSAFVRTFTADGVFNDVVAGNSYRGATLGDVPQYMVSIFPDVHRELKRITVNGDVISVELAVQGTFNGSMPTPAGTLKGNGAKVDAPMADFWYLRHGKIDKFDCYVGYTALYHQMGVELDWASAVGSH